MSGCPGPPCPTDILPGCGTLSGGSLTLCLLLPVLERDLDKAVRTKSWLSNPNIPPAKEKENFVDNFFLSECPCLIFLSGNVCSGPLF